MVQQVKDALTSGWLNGILLPLMLAVMSYVYLEGEERSAERDAAQAAKLEKIEVSLSQVLIAQATQAQSIQLLSADRYTATQAASDRALMDQRIARVEDWTGNLSNRLATFQEQFSAFLHEYSRNVGE